MVIQLVDNGVPGQIEMRNVEINIIKASPSEGSLAIRYFMNERNKGYSLLRGHSCATAVGIGLKDGLNLDIFISIFPARIQKEAYQYSSVDISFPRSSDFDDTYDIYDRYLTGFEKSWW